MIAKVSTHLTELIVPGSPTAEKIMRYARSKGLQSHDAEDMAQETALRCLGYAAKFPDRLHGERTVIGIAKHCVMNEHRRRRQKHCALTSYSKLDQIAESQPSSSIHMPTREDIEQQLGRFKPRIREIVVRRLIDRESVAEIAENMRITESAVRSRLLHLRKAFRLLSPKIPTSAVALEELRREMAEEAKAVGNFYVGEGALRKTVQKNVQLVKRGVWAK